MSSDSLLGNVLCGISILLTNLAAYLLIVVWTFICIVLFPAVFGILKTVTGWRPDRVMRYIGWLYGRGLVMIMLPFVRFKHEGGKPRSPVIFVANHLSFSDVYFMGGLAETTDIAFAVRSWPFRMPWFTFFMKLARYPDVERLGWKDADAAFRDLLANGTSLFFFPEGHRSRDGKLQRFYSGAFKMSIETGVPVVPLCITGTDRLLPPGRLLMKPAKVCVRVLPPVDPAGFPGELGHLQMRRHVRKLISDAIEKEQSALSCG